MAAPYALHQLVVVDAAGDAVIRLNAYDTVVPSNKVRSKIYWELSLIIIPYHTTVKLTKKKLNYLMMPCVRCIHFVHKLTAHLHCCWFSIRW